jgi:glycosyltransferase involved in cell wall biosynthesis
MKLKLVVTHYAGYDYLQECLSSISKQSFSNYDKCVIDDAHANKGKIANIIDAITMLRPDDEDVIVILDGDDYLNGTEALSTIYKTYSNTDCLMTYGSYITNKGKKGVTKDIPKKVIKSSSYRSSPWIYSHPKTFKGKLWKKMKDKWLRNPETGEYYTCAVDHALMYPLLEMANGRVEHIKTPVYVYRVDNPNSLHNRDADEQIRVADIINNQPKCKAADFG